jgi:hypothetical protein
LSLSLLFSLASFADEPATKPADSADKPAAADAAASTQGAAVAPAAASAQANSAAEKSALDQDAEAKKMRSMGYKPKHVGSNTLWCKKEVKLGTHFETENCMSAEVALARQKSDKEWAEKVQKTIPPSAK